ncbi:MAG: hypothetical protein AAFR61_25335 [Bacteroidota bacterium]
MLRYVLGISLMVLVACQNNEKDPHLEDAFKVHQMALKVRDSVEMELKAIPLDSLTGEQQQMVKQLEEAVHQWEDQLVEVPGFEHAEGHDHNHDHDHDHAKEELMENLPPLEILKLQEALAQEVQGLLQQARQLAGSLPTSP